MFLMPASLRVLVAQGTTRPERERREWAVRRGGAFRLDVSDIKLAQMLAVNDEIAKIPEAMLRRAARAGARWEVVTGRGVTVHPDLAYLSGVQPKQWPPGLIWDDANGAGGDDGSGPMTIVVANGIGPGFTQAWNLILHEHGHTIDRALRCPFIRETWADFDGWESLHAANIEAGLIGTAYERAYPGEYWAESFARYYCCMTGRITLPANVRAYFYDLAASCA